MELLKIGESDYINNHTLEEFGKMVQSKICPAKYHFKGEPTYPKEKPQPAPATPASRGPDCLEPHICKGTIEEFAQKLATYPVENMVENI